MISVFMDEFFLINFKDWKFVLYVVKCIKMERNDLIKIF